MHIRTKLAAVLVVLTLLGGMLAACAPSVNADNFVGDWEFTHGSLENLDQATVDEAKSLGANAIMTLNEDGTGSFDMYGNVKQLTWSATSDTEGSLTLDGNKAASMAIEDEELVLSDSSDNTLTFSRYVPQDESNGDSAS